MSQQYNRPPTLTTASGAPVDDNQNSITAGPRGPVLLQDYWLLEKLATFNRERIPERIVHAKGSAAHGTLTITNDIKGCGIQQDRNTGASILTVFDCSW